jgi:hypothetical protein
VLDLDETLVHCTVEPIQNPDHMFRVRFNEEVTVPTSFCKVTSNIWKVLLMYAPVPPILVRGALVLQQLPTSIALQL